jgi:valyl-tRNA synthetase
MVIPAKAGIHVSVDAMLGMDPRLRGDDIVGAHSRTVIPAKAGIHVSLDAMLGMDPRLRGDDIVSGTDHSQFVIPAKAGIHVSVDAMLGMDPRIRGDDIISGTDHSQFVIPAKAGIHVSVDAMLGMDPLLRGDDIISGTDHSQFVIPAKAGIHVSVDAMLGMDPRLRGDDIVGAHSRTVIPAKAGIHVSLDAMLGMDPRLRGDDSTFTLDSCLTGTQQALHRLASIHPIQNFRRMPTNAETTPLAKAYAPQDVEKKWYAEWEADGLFYADRAEEKKQDPTGRRAIDKKPFVVVIPPPNVTGILHVGHALNNTIQDTYIRYHRMLGHEALWMPGTDHAGIATQSKIEKVMREEGLTRHDLGREKFVERVWEWKAKYGDIIVDQLRALGCSADWRRLRFTMDDKYYEAVIECFVRLHEKGLIYRGKRIINWSPLAQSALSDEEVIHKVTEGKLYFFKYPIIGTKGNEPEYLTIATTRPETMLGDVAVAVNPNDERYKHLVGKFLMLPLMDREIPIIADDYVDPTFGSGCVKITPAHDPNDFEIGLRHNLPQINVMDTHGVINDLGGRFEGFDRFDARKKVVEELQLLGLVDKIESYTHSVGYSERGGEMIEPYLSDQWFVNMKPLAEPALRVVENGLVQFHPERWINTYRHWMTNIRDWCISRQIWWGHRIPAWYAEDGNIFVGRNEEEARAKATADGYTGKLNQDEDVLDTWFSSWLWPFATFGWPENTLDLQEFYPTSLLSTGPDILFFWVARMIMAGMEFMKGLPMKDGTLREKDEDLVPFRDVYLHNIIRDQQGRKMSKSLGNSPDPFDLIATYGTDAVRFTLLYLAPLGQDVRFGEESCEIGRNFANKLWNATRFIIMKRDEFHTALPTVQFESEDTELINSQAVQSDERKQANTGGFTMRPATTLADKWMLSRANRAARDVKKAFDAYEINEVTKVLYDFIWKDFCDWYLEVVKIQPASTPLAVEILEGIMRMLHPIMPFLTEELWHALTGEAANVLIGQDDYITPDTYKIDDEAEAEFAFVQRTIEAVRLLRSTVNYAPSKAIDLVIQLKDGSDLALLESARTIVERMARTSTLTIERTGTEYSSLEYAGELLGGRGQVFVKLEARSEDDRLKERTRLEKELERIVQQLTAVTAKLDNESFVSRAPPAVIVKEREKQTNYGVQVEKLTASLQELR